MEKLFENILALITVAICKDYMYILAVSKNSIFQCVSPSLYPLLCYINDATIPVFV